MSAVMPGRAVDIVHAAVLAAGELPGAMTVSFSTYSGTGITLHLSGANGAKRDETAGRRVFAALGVTDVTLSAPWSTPPIANLTAARVPALGDVTFEIVVHVHDHVPEAAADDVVDALVADVDAARAAEDAAGGAA